MVLHERIDMMMRRDRCRLYYAVGILASAIALALDARVSSTGAMVLLGLVAAFLAMRLYRELRPDRMAVPPELRVILRKPRSE